METQNAAARKIAVPESARRVDAGRPHTSCQVGAPVDDPAADPQDPAGGALPWYYNSALPRTLR
jgi:hypothetical protein